ncbi:hypothetical protein VPH35_110335 [Triticum aestivum]
MHAATALHISISVVVGTCVIAVLITSNATVFAAHIVGYWMFLILHVAGCCSFSLSISLWMGVTDLLLCSSEITSHFLIVSHLICRRRKKLSSRGTWSALHKERIMLLELSSIDECLD